MGSIGTMGVVVFKTERDYNEMVKRGIKVLEMRLKNR